MPNDRDVIRDPIHGEVTRESIVESMAPSFSIEASAYGRTWFNVAVRDITGLLQLPAEMLVDDPVASHRRAQAEQMRRLEATLGERLRALEGAYVTVLASMRPRIVTDLSEAPADLTRLVAPSGRRLRGPRGTGSLDADLRWAARPRPALGTFAPGLVLGVTFKATDDGVILASATWGWPVDAPPLLFGVDLGGVSWSTATTYRNEPGPGLTIEALRQAWESLQAVAEPDGRTQPIPIEWIDSRLPGTGCGHCESCRRRAQFEHLTHFVAGDQVQAFLEYARRGEREPFVELAGVLGVAPELHEEMWTGTVALVAHGAAGPRARRLQGDRPTAMFMDELEPEPIRPEQAAIYPADPNDYGTGPDDELAIQKMAARARARTATVLGFADPTVVHGPALPQATVDAIAPPITDADPLIPLDAVARAIRETLSRAVVVEGHACAGPGCAVCAESDRPTEGSA